MITVSIEDALRYAGVRAPTEKDRTTMAERAEGVLRAAPPRYVYRVLTPEESVDGVLLREAGLTLPGTMARKMLSGCRSAAVMVCTLGAAFDTLLRQAQARNMAEALLLDACGSAAVEAGCDEMEKEIAALFPDLFLTDRFSPGYGDLPLTLQGPLLALCGAEKRLGVHATDSCLLLPVKTVTAVAGIADTPRPARIRGCDYCTLKDHCSLRKGGISCALES